MLKIKYGNNKKENKVDRESFLLMKDASKLITGIKKVKKTNTALTDELQLFIKNSRANMRRNDKEMPVTFYREIKGLGNFEYKGVKRQGENIVSLYKQANESVKKQIKQARESRKKLNVFNDTFVTASDGESHQIMKLGPNAVRNIIDTKTGKKIDEVSLNAGVFAEPGTILRIMRWKHCKEIFKNKAPTDNKKYVGIELEFFCDATDKTLAYAFYEEGLVKYLSLGSDGSVRPEPGKYGHELRILCQETEVESVVRNVYKVLSKYNAKVNKSCGTHVHLDMRSRDRKMVFANLVKAQNIFYKMNPKYRKEGQFSRPTVHSDLDAAFANNPGGRNSRYWGVNFESLSRHQTFEIRIHAGMVDADKIINWVKLLVHIANIDSVVPAYKTVAGFFKKYAIPADLKEYVSKRIELMKEGETDIEEAA